MKRRACAVSMLLPMVLGLSACGSIGEKDFACPGRPPGVRCMSTSEVYRATHYTDTVDPPAAKALGDEPRKRDSTRRPQQASAPARSSRPHPQAEMASADSEASSRRPIPQVDRPIPIRTPAQVMRAWIAPWEDVRGVLYGGEHAFIEIVSRRWSIGERETGEPVRLFSFQEPSESTPQKDDQRREKPAATHAKARPERSSTHPSSKTGVSK